MMTPPHWAPELDPFLFIFKAGYTLLILAINLSCFYLNAFWLIPQLLRKRRYARYFFFLLLLFSISITLEFGIYHLPVFSPAQTSALMHTIRVDAIFKLLLLLISFLYRFSKDWFEHEEHKTRLESAKLSAELDLLKFQIHPHFLFNTLNNIYSLAMQEGSPKTVRSLGKLGGIMHYMLEDCQETYVNLSKELEYLEQYIDLQQLRVDQQNNITVSVDIEGKAGILKIAPMLLIAFVENAFKHGLSIREQSFINLKIAISANEFYFNITNAVHQRKQDLNGTGLGLKNVQRRLMMLYPQRHTLIIEEKNQEFKVSLTIRLDEV
jgi:LytS/YehU family sensor histidine kinase